VLNRNTLKDLKLDLARLIPIYQTSKLLIQDISTNNEKPIKDTFFLPIFSSKFPTIGDATRLPTSEKLKWLI
jgi:hypothetical protein